MSKKPYFNSKTIYKKVDKMRLDKGWSIYHLAEVAEVSVNSIYSWRDRGSSPTLYLIDRIATAFDINPISLLLDEKDIFAIQEEHQELFEIWSALKTKKKTAFMNMLRSFKRENE